MDNLKTEKPAVNYLIAACGMNCGIFATCISGRRTLVPDAGRRILLNRTTALPVVSGIANTWKRQSPGFATIAQNIPAAG
jgi:hypothetical protein